MKEWAMSWWRRWWEIVTGRADADLDRELRAHLEAEADEHDADRGRAGLDASTSTGSHASWQSDGDAVRTRAAALAAARRAFGNATRTKEQVREAWGWVRWEQLLQDTRFAVRTLRRHPGFTLVAILSLALGIGANTTIFTFLNAIVLRPLPYPEPDRIVIVQERSLLRDGALPAHPFNFLQWQQRARSFESMALLQTIPFNAMGPDGADQVMAIMTTPDLFRVFGVSPWLGRWLTADDAISHADANGVLVVSYEFWQRRFGGDPAAIGRSLIVNGHASQIVGVAPPAFRVATIAADVYVPMPADQIRLGSRSFFCFARLRSHTDAVARVDPAERASTSANATVRANTVGDVDVAAAQAELTAMAAQLAREAAIDKDMGVTVTRLHDYLVQNSRGTLALLMGVVAMVLLIACLNLASLLLTRGIGRQSELAIRASLGAGRLRLVRQLVVESLVIAFAGGALGLLFAQGAVTMLIALARNAITFGRDEAIAPDWHVLVFTIGLSTLTALLFGLLPAWSACRVDPQIALRERGRGGSGGGRRHTQFRSLLVIGEVAIAVMLLVGAGLLLRTFAKMLQVDLGFRPDHVLTTGLFLGGGDASTRANLVEQMLQRLEAVPGVTSASTIRFPPMAGDNSGSGFRFIDEGSAASPSQVTEVSLVSRGYFTTLGIPVLQGRAFGAQDRLGSPRVAMVNRAFVRRFCADGRALGRRILVQWTDEAPTEIIGIAGDVSYHVLTTEPKPTVYLVHAQAPGYVTKLVVRTTGDPIALAAAVRREVQAVDPTRSVSAMKTMAEYVDESLARPRLYAAMLAAFAALALLLAGIGLYGLMAYAVSQRTHEIGIRMALGAPRRSITRAVVTQGAWLAAIGLTIGIAAAVLLTRLLQNLLFGVTPTDAATYALVAIVLAAVSLIAAYVPARRAARVDPMIALRCD
jgi:putative ABC transport system permease protein